ncbi:hypothetical protein EYF80_025973 [Liparis tanakae]|uniref:Uncharacterized protein n=1 Tax=Liparis tanakae TaxID=230148 RepID=A0A4Z2HDT5_9TELE|nr:hypothetical protein EYF80_025973 [Liparis tanakae]
MADTAPMGFLPLCSAGWEEAPSSEVPRRKPPPVRLKRRQILVVRFCPLRMKLRRRAELRPRLLLHVLLYDQPALLQKLFAGRAHYRDPRSETQRRFLRYPIGLFVLLLLPLVFIICQRALVVPLQLDLIVPPPVALGHAFPPFALSGVLLLVPASSVELRLPVFGLRNYFLWPDSIVVVRPRPLVFVFRPRQSVRLQMSRGGHFLFILLFLLRVLQSFFLLVVVLFVV